MSEREPSLRGLILARAWRGTLDAFDTTHRALGLAVLVIFISLATQYFRFGFAAMKADLLNTFWASIWPVLAVGGFVVLWNLWLAPYELAMEAAQQAKDIASKGPMLAVAAPAALLPKTPDEDLITLASKARLVGERYAILNGDPLANMYFRDVEHSSHAVWLDGETNELRRQFCAAMARARKLPADVPSHQAAQIATTNLIKRLVEAANA